MARTIKVAALQTSYGEQLVPICSVDIEASFTMQTLSESTFVTCWVGSATADSASSIDSAAKTSLDLFIRFLQPLIFAQFLLTRPRLSGR